MEKGWDAGMNTPQRRSESGETVRIQVEGAPYACVPPVAKTAPASCPRAPIIPSLSSSGRRPRPKCQELCVCEAPWPWGMKVEDGSKVANQGTVEEGDHSR